MMYSQGNEEQVILDYFKGKAFGRFLDLGAYDGLMFSNVRALADRGWEGVCVEASPQCFVSLQRNMSMMPKVKLLCAAVTWERPTNRLVYFHDSGGAVASMNDAHFDKWKTVQKDFTDIWVAQIHVEDLVNQFGPFDFLSIDLEGITYDVLRKYPFHTEKLLCVEVDDGAKPPHETGLIPSVFKVIARTSDNIIYGV